MTTGAQGHRGNADENREIRDSLPRLLPPRPWPFRSNMGLFYLKERHAQRSPLPQNFGEIPTKSRKTQFHLKIVLTTKVQRHEEMRMGQMGQIGRIRKVMAHDLLMNSLPKAASRCVCRHSPRRKRTMKVHGMSETENRNLRYCYGFCPDCSRGESNGAAGACAAGAFVLFSFLYRCRSSHDRFNP